MRHLASREVEPARRCIEMSKRARALEPGAQEGAGDPRRAKRERHERRVLPRTELLVTHASRLEEVGANEAVKRPSRLALDLGTCLRGGDVRALAGESRARSSDAGAEHPPPDGAAPAPCCSR